MKTQTCSKLTAKSMLVESGIPVTKQTLARIYRLRSEIKRHAIGGFYRMNAGSADIYTFGLFGSELKRGDFHGGWAWLAYPSTHDSDWCVDLATGKFQRIMPELDLA